jgi:hypothetical protein
MLFSFLYQTHYNRGVNIAWQTVPMVDLTQQKEEPMWLEEFVWLWLPIVSGVGCWLIGSHLMVRAQVRRLRERLARLETRTESSDSDQRRAA